MKFCVLIYRGQVVEVAPVDDDHDFGEHGNHWHLEARVVEKHMCEESPTLRTDDEHRN